MSYPTSRIFARSLSQAFADERAVCVYLPPKRIGYQAVNWTLALAFVVVVLSVIFQGAVT